MRLVDREFQLTRLDQLLDDARAGRGRIALVSGALGSGKTALLEAFADRVARTGTTFVSAAGSWAERGLRFGVLSQVLEDAGVSSPARYVELRELAERTPMVIAVDDVQLADPPSLNGLLALVRRMRSARLLFVFTEQLGQLRSAFLLELLRLPHCTPVDLDPLTLPGVTALAGDREAARVHALSRGNPLLVRALLDDDLPTAVARCLHHGGPSVRQTAQAVAVLGQFATPAAISRLTGVDRRAVTRALAVLAAAGLLDERRFRHPATRDAVLSGTPSVLHARAARLLHEQGAAPEIVACRLLNGPPRQRDWVVPVLRTAAARSARRTGFAVRCLELAHQSSVDAREQAEVTAELARLEFRSNPLAASRHLTALRAGDAKVMLISQLLWHGRVAEVRDLLEEHDPDVERWLASAHPSLARWRPSDSPLTSLLFRDDPSAASRAEAFLRSAPLTGDLPWGEVFALLTLIYRDRLDSASAWCDRLLEETADHVTWQAMFSSLRAEIALRRGDLRACVRLAGSAFGLLPPRAWGTAVVGPLSCLILACTRIGRHADADEYVRQPVPEVAFQTRFAPHYLHARGEYHLAAHRPDAALDDFMSCGELMRSWGQDHPGVVPWRVCAARALLAQDRRDRARRLLHEQLRLTAPRSRVGGSALRVLAATCKPGTRVRMLTESAEILEERGDRFELAHALADLSGAVGHLTRARMTARRAWHVARECGAEPLCEQLLPDDVPASAQVAALTGAERRVAALAADGHTNREIARKLFVTTSTVEQHLTRVYRKLDIKYRAEIPAGFRPPLHR